MDERPDTGRPRPATTTGRSELLVSLRWPLTVIALAAIALFAYLATVHQIGRAAEGAGALAERTTQRAREIAAGLWTGNVTERFVSSIPEIAGDGSGLLELARAETVETFTRSDERRILWDLIPLGTTVTEIRVPVTYRYHLRLDDPWRLEVTGQTCVVYAPPIRPSLPPAIHTERLEKRVAESWLRFDAAEQLEMLHKSLTPRLVARAGNPRHLALVREAGRRTVARFVRDWLLRENQWRQDRLLAITVVFPDEAPDDPATRNVTIEWDDG